jgi:hypothetical protein
MRGRACLRLENADGGCRSLLVDTLAEEASIACMEGCGLAIRVVFLGSFEALSENSYCEGCVEGLGRMTLTGYAYISTYLFRLADMSHDRSWRYLLSRWRSNYVPFLQRKDNMLVES